MALYLASQSPRRREILQQIGVAFTTLVPEVDESRHAGEEPAAYVQRLAQAKAAAGLALIAEQEREATAVALGADTIVVVDGAVLGKPRDLDGARAMLGALSGREHQVMSAVCLHGASKSRVALSTTEVSFRAISAGEIEAYWQSGEPSDKAGAYGIQGLGAVFVTGIRGSYSGVVGLPIESLFPLLQEFEIPFWQRGLSAQ